MSDHLYGNPLRRPRRVGPRGRTTELPPNDWTADEVERRIRHEAVVWLYVFDPTGRQVARFRGTADAVDLSDELKRNSSGLYGVPVLSDHSFVHNHPVWAAWRADVSFPPSPSDLMGAIERDIQSLIVISGESRYQIDRPGDVWRSDEYLMADLIGVLEGEFNRTEGGDEESLSFRIRRLHFVLGQLSQEGWIGYERTLYAGNT